MPDDAPSDGNTRANRIAAAGWIILVLSAGAALLPIVGRANGALLVGALLVVSGIAEIWAGSQRRETHRLAMAAGAVTTLAGLLFATDPATKFLPTLYIIMGWLFIRSLLLALAFRLEKGSVRTWTGLSAAMDFLLALILAAGLSIATVVVSLFGPIPQLIASFAWFLALSFIVTGLMLLEVASCARESDDV